MLKFVFSYDKNTLFCLKYGYDQKEKISICVRTNLVWYWDVRYRIIGRDEQLVHAYFGYVLWPRDLCGVLWSY